MPPSRLCPTGPAVFPYLAVGRRAVSFQNRHAAPPPAAPVEGARAARRACSTCAIRRAASSIGSPRRRSNRASSLPAGAPAFSRDLSEADEAAPAAVCEDGALEPVPAQPDHHPPFALGRALLRSVPLARVGGAFRIAVPGPLPDAPLPGGSGAFARPSRLHVRRNGNVPAALPAGSGTRRIRPRSGARDRISAQRRPFAAGFHRARARPLERRDAVRRSRAPAQTLRKSARRAQAARRAGARPGAAERRGDDAILAAGRGGDCGSWWRDTCNRPCA